jgi:hypothetical protein
VNTIPETSTRYQLSYRHGSVGRPPLLIITEYLRPTDILTFSSISVFLSVWILDFDPGSVSPLYAWVLGPWLVV